MSGQFLAEPFVDAIKAGLATLALLLFVWGIAVRRAGRPRTDQRWRDRSLACLGIVSALAWYNFFSFHFTNYVHIWEHYHYYIGAKYAPELGYTRIYECTAVAELDQGRRDLVLARTIRDLRENRSIATEQAEALTRPELCKSHFSAERWRAFKKDIAYFRGEMSLERWTEVQQDHGYNASPVWELLGYPHRSRGEIENDASLLEPWSEWKNARRSTFERRRWAYALLVLALVLLTARAVAEQEDWVALILGIGLIPIATYLACYYYSILLGYGLLWEKTENRIGVGLCALSVVTYLMAQSWSWWDQLYTGTSVAVLVFVLWVTTEFARREKPQRG